MKTILLTLLSISTIASADLITGPAYISLTNVAVIAAKVQRGWTLTNTLDGSLQDENGNYLIRPCRVPLIAKLAYVMETNWVTTSIETPVPSGLIPGEPPYTVTLLYRATGYHQTGTITSNTIANIEWNGKVIHCVLESVQVGQEQRTTWK